tara:strand:+ start:3018 stop:3362 length:345 start_codon:yes stop_codon:yes gene_type:complete
MKLSSIILNENNYSQQASSLENEIEKHFKQFNPSVSMAEYHQDRRDDDPLKGKGFGHVSLIVKEDIPEDDFNSIKQIVSNKGYEIRNSENEFESDPGERDYYPKINFNFNLEKS